MHVLPRRQILKLLVRSHVLLSWTPLSPERSTDVLPRPGFERSVHAEVSSAPVSGLAFTDNSPPIQQKIFMVRAIKPYNRRQTVHTQILAMERSHRSRRSHEAFPSDPAPGPRRQPSRAAPFQNLGFDAANTNTLRFSQAHLSRHWPRRGPAARLGARTGATPSRRSGLTCPCSPRIRHFSSARIKASCSNFPVEGADALYLVGAPRRPGVFRCRNAAKFQETRSC